ncbi:hypothetical protein M4951_24065 [Blastopirellula sp. J2-11]|uniref:hypothetical protein n=1 Tax=Blastopirellula sp. J2-11 TaxID=2943192 RepID=UPI0021C5DD19|nr:hypothetical protein [Blastopirellula sp. J2-11]UUO06409.1 hypothetical protein M4951_24065 [Blastopirellula sp. J2-11]
MSDQKSLWRFSLRTFLIIFTICAVALGWTTRYVHQRKAAFAAIREAGGKFQWNASKYPRLEAWFGQELFGNPWSLELREGKEKVDNELLQQVSLLHELVALDLSNADIDDQGIEQIAHLPLRELWLQSTHITNDSAQTLSKMKTLTFLQLNATDLSDDFLEQLEPLPELDDLGLRGTKVTGPGLQALSRHPKLKDLDLYHTDVDNAGVQLLIRCSALVNLGLSMTKITDDVFQHLAQLPNLTNADLSGNRAVSSEAVFEFKKTHPQCVIEGYK